MGNGFLYIMCNLIHGLAHRLYDLRGYGQGFRLDRSQGAVVIKPAASGRNQNDSLARPLRNGLLLDKCRTLDGTAYGR